MLTKFGERAISGLVLLRIGTISEVMDLRLLWSFVACWGSALIRFL